MVCQGPVAVRGRGGLRGVIETGSPAKGEQQVRVVFDGGRSMFIPTSLLTALPDGSFELALGPADLGAYAVGAAQCQASADERVTVAAGEAVTIPVIEEHADITTRTVESGRVLIHVTPRQREEVVNVPLAQERLEVERVPVNRVVQQPEAIRQEGDVTIVPVYEEVLVVEKRLMLKEEVRLTRHRTTAPHEQRVTLRREEVRVEHAAAPDGAAAADPTKKRQT